MVEHWKPPPQSIQMSLLGEAVGLLDAAFFGLRVQPAVRSVTNTRTIATRLVTDRSLAGADYGLSVLEIAVKAQRVLRKEGINRPRKPISCTLEDLIQERTGAGREGFEPSRGLYT